MKRFIRIFILITYLIPAYHSPAQDTTNQYIPIVSPDTYWLDAFDSLGQKQGYWKVRLEILSATNNKDKIEGIGYGFFVDNKKEGYWDIYSTNKENLIAQQFYQNDMVLYQIDYEKNRIESIIQGKTIQRGDNGDDTIIYKTILFDKKGRIKSIKHIDVGNKSDSLGQKQGYWEILTETFSTDEKTLGILKGTGYGFFVDNKREGYWDIYNISNKEDMIAQRFYQNDTVLYEIKYKKGKIKSITQRKRIRRHSNIGRNFAYIDNIIIFGNNGEIKSREFIAPDGVPEKRVY